MAALLDCDTAVLGSDPVCPQPTANSVSPLVGCHLGWHNTGGCPLRGGNGTKIYIKLNVYVEKNGENAVSIFSVTVDLLIDL